MPAVGDKVVFIPGIRDNIARIADQASLTGLIACVITSTKVNVAVFDSHGQPHSRENVPFMTDDSLAATGFYCKAA